MEMYYSTVPKVLKTSYQRNNFLGQGGMDSLSMETNIFTTLIDTATNARV